MEGGELCLKTGRSRVGAAPRPGGGGERGRKKNSGTLMLGTAAAGLTAAPSAQ